ncbi:MAG: hypothetical protein ACPG31_00540 [Planctomycetota bacterium]
MVKVADRPEFAEIPPHVREGIEIDVRAAAFETLHAEAVSRKDLSAAPGTLFDKMPGRVVRLLLFLGIGGVIGTISCLIAIYLMRLLVTIV